MLKYIAFAGFLAFAPAACTTSPPPVVTTTVQYAEKSLTALHQLHDTAAVELSFAAKARLIHGTTAATAKDYLDRSEVILVKADADFAAGKDIANEIGPVAGLIANATNLLPH